MAEFLPLCDVLFNVISLAGYFCDVVFDVVMGYALLERGYKGSFAAAISIVITSLLISQVLSFRWYLHVWWSGEERKGRAPWLPLVLHCLQCGVLWRYARLLVPLELRRVKHQVRDLCMLRLVHAFCEAAPMLLLQLHILFKDSQRAAESASELGGEPSVDEPNANKAFSELNVISASLSLFSVCWALASFSKNVRMQNVHRLVLTWCGVIFQFLWRLGTISARICALTVYGLVYEYWVFLVIGLHWLSMFLWLVSPRHAFQGERLSRARRAALSALLAAVYVLAYVNLHHRYHTHKMVIFYIVMCVENSLLVSLWTWSGRARRPAATVAFAAGAFAAGLVFMMLYYRYFHVRRLGYMLGDQQGTNSTNASSQNKNGSKSNQADNAAIPGVFNCRFSNPVNANARKKKKPTSFVPPPAAPAPAFWRRPAPAHNHHGGSSENEGSSVGSRVNIQQKLQEKKQKQLAELRVIEEEIKQGKLAKTTPVAAEEIYSSLQRQPIPRAKTHAEPAWPSIELTHSYQNYPIAHNCNYPTYTEISEDYTEKGRLSRRPLYVLGSSCGRTPARSPNYLEDASSPHYEDNLPDTKRPQNDMYNEGEIGEYSTYCENTYKGEYPAVLQRALVQSIDSMRNYTCAQYARNCERFPYPGLGAKKMEQMRKMQRCRTPEILLAPHYLEGCSRQVCCHWGAPYPTKRKEDGAAASSGEESSPEAGARETPRPPSDIDSQISLPRSYTLPREFRYWRRRPRLRDTHVPSNNSSDGDVDSADDNESDRRSNLSAGSQLRGSYELCNAPRPDLMPRQEPPCDERRRRPSRKAAPKPETKL